MYIASVIFRKDMYCKHYLLPALSRVLSGLYLANQE